MSTLFRNFMCVTAFEYYYYTKFLAKNVPQAKEDPCF